jgi:hypothetical protein
MNRLSARTSSRDAAQAARLYDLLERTARLLPMWDAALFTSTSRWPSSFREALCRGCDGALIRVVELKDAGIRSALRGPLQGDRFVPHNNLLFTSSPHQFLIEFLKSRIMLTINSTRMRVLIRRSIFRSAGRFWHGNLVAVLDIL